MEIFTNILTTGTLAFHVVLAIIIIVSLASKPMRAQTASFLQKRGLVIAWAVSLISTVTPLIYSEVFALEPCRYCWFQRIAMFPLLFITTTALVKKDAPGAAEMKIESMRVTEPY